MKAGISCFLPFLFAVSIVAEESYRTFTDTEGRSIEAMPSMMSGNSIIVKLKNGRTYTIPVNKLSPPDQQFVAKWKETAPKPIPRMIVDFTSGRRNEGEKGFSDLRIETLSPKVKVVNQDSRYEIEKAKATYFAFGKHIAARNNLKVLQKASFVFSLKPGETIEHAGKTIQHQYDDEYVKYGYKYTGYLVVLQDSNGKVVQSIGSTGFEKFAEMALPLSQDAIIDRKFQPAEDPGYIY
tara:strand:- start:13782 stop:14495 length:714 start_codon:yes stop_codon:yes gene_type:complete